MQQPFKGGAGIEFRGYRTTKKNGWKDGSNINECLEVVSNKVSEEMNSSLMSPISSYEVEQVVFDLGHHKAPGPDGFDGLFFQKNWAIMKDDITKAVTNFFENGDLTEEINATVVALILKVPMSEFIGQLRPISCCNFLYKVIAKVMVSRLKPHMNNLITQQRSAFVGNRLIQDNLVLAQEAFHTLKGRKP